MNIYLRTIEPDILGGGLGLFAPGVEFAENRFPGTGIWLVSNWGVLEVGVVGVVLGLIVAAGAPRGGLLIARVGRGDGRGAHDVGPPFLGGLSIWMMIGC